MTKRQVLKKVKKLHFPKGSYVVYGATPLAAYGIRDANDIDLFVSEELYKQLENKGWQKVCKGPQDEPVTFDIFEAHKTWKFSPYAPSFQELLTRSIEVEGITFASLEDVRKWKEASGRPKDVVDLQLIADFLAKENIKKM